MYLTLTNVVRNLSKSEYETLKEMCRYSNNLYNVALYNIRQYYFVEKKFLNYKSNYHVCKSNENYKLLQAGISQQILKVVDRNFKSFFNLIKKASHNEYRFQDIHIPRYREKGGIFNLILSTNAISINDGYLKVPMSQEFSKTHKGIKIPFPSILEGKEIKEVRICPIYGGRYFKIQYCYKEEALDLNLNKENALAIDLGITNLATCVTNNGTSFIVDGRKLKSINQYWNKQIAKLQSISDKQGIKRTSKMCKLTMQRNNRVKDYINKSTRHIVNYCIANNIGNIVSGYNQEFQRNSNIGKANNQKFVQIPYGNFRITLRNLCERYGITYIEQEESYTSLASFWDKDEIPIYNPNAQNNYKYSGHRVYRGMYKTKEGKYINADLNGALNILRKSNVVSVKGLYSSGVLGAPIRIRVA